MGGIQEVTGRFSILFSVMPILYSSSNSKSSQFPRPKTWVYQHKMENALGPAPSRSLSERRHGETHPTQCSAQLLTAHKALEPQAKRAVCAEATKTPF